MLMFQKLLQRNCLLFFSRLNENGLESIITVPEAEVELKASLGISSTSATAPLLSVQATPRNHVRVRLIITDSLLEEIYTLMS